MIRRWVILGILSVVVLILMKDLYGAIMYDPFHGIEAKTAEGKKPGMISARSFEQAWGKEIIDNNLFSPTRNPVQPKPMRPEEMPRRPEMVLKGIILSDTGEYVAYIEKDKAKAVPVRKGDKLDDVEIVDVGQKKVDMKWRDETITLSLERIKTIKPR